PDGVFRASALALGAVGSYSTFSPFHGQSRAVCFLWHSPSTSLSTCLPRVSNPPKRKVTRHRALWCSDFPPPSTLSRDRSDSPPFQNQRKYSFFNQQTQALVGSRQLTEDKELGRIEPGQEFSRCQCRHAGEFEIPG